MIEQTLQIALSTLTVCIVVMAFSYATARFWSWFLKIDMLLFWLSAISKKIDKGVVQNTPSITDKKTKWKEMYKQLLDDKRHN